MKNKIWDFLKALAAFTVILLFLFLLTVCFIAEFFPAIIPDWAYTVMGIVSIPLGIIFFVTVFKEWHRQRKAKKEAQKNK